jgi:hypothetical protein
MATPILSDEAILAQVPAARARAASHVGPRATQASYHPATGRVLVELSNGCQIGFPSDLAQGLRGASPSDLAQVEVVLDGAALRWDRLDADFLVSGLLKGMLGTEGWMRQVAREMGRRGGSARSEAKARAARRNGRKGGRPRKGGSG